MKCEHCGNLTARSWIICRRCWRTPDGFRALWQRTIREYEKLTGVKTDRPHFHDIRAKSISDNENLNDAYMLAGHIDIAMTRKTYDRNRRRVQPLR